jgi:hypothetical protein
MSRSDPGSAPLRKPGRPPPGRRGPSGAEVAAIAAAVELVWPRSEGPSEPVPPARSWRFSGRWWLPDRSLGPSWPPP